MNCRRTAWLCDLYCSCMLAVPRQLLHGWQKHIVTLSSELSIAKQAAITINQSRLASLESITCNETWLTTGLYRVDRLLCSLFLFIPSGLVCHCECADLESNCDQKQASLHARTQPVENHRWCADSATPPAHS